MVLSGIVEIDLHGQTVRQARTTIDAALRRAGPGVYRLRLIHGHHGGTALRQMIREEYPHHPKVRRVAAVEFGCTYLVLREL